MKTNNIDLWTLLISQGMIQYNIYIYTCDLYIYIYIRYIYIYIMFTYIGKESQRGRGRLKRASLLMTKPQKHLENPWKSAICRSVSQEISVFHINFSLMQGLDQKNMFGPWTVQFLGGSRWWPNPCASPKRHCQYTRQFLERMSETTRNDILGTLW